MRLTISLRTVDVTSYILAKLKFTSRTQIAVRRAGQKQGFTHDQPGPHPPLPGRQQANLVLRNVVVGCAACQATCLGQLRLIL